MKLVLTAYTEDMLLQCLLLCAICQKKLEKTIFFVKTKVRKIFSKTKKYLTLSHYERVNLISSFYAFIKHGEFYELRLWIELWITKI